MHRVGLAVVQLTRSTFAEAIAGREGLQPSALRARCTWKPSPSFRECQTLSKHNCRKYRQISIARAFWSLAAMASTTSTQKCTESGAPSSGFPTDLRRSDCLSESHQPQALLPRCNRDTTGLRHRRQAPTNDKTRTLRVFLYNQHILALSAVCSI